MIASRNEENDWNLSTWENVQSDQMANQTVTDQEPALASTAMPMTSQSAEELAEMRNAIPGLFDLIPGRLLKKQ